MTIVLGLICAALYGIGDFIAGIGGRNEGSKDAPAGIAFVSVIVGAALSGLYLLLLSDDRLAGRDLLLACAAGVLMTAARLLFFQGVVRWPMVTFVPVVGVTAVVVPSIGGLAAGQSLALIEAIGVALAVPAVVLLSSGRTLPRFGELSSSPVVWTAVLVGSLVGVAGLLLSFISDAAGSAPAFASTLIGVALTPLLCRQLGMSVVLNRTTVRFGAIAGCITVLAFSAAALTFQRSNAAIGSAFISLAPGVTIALAWKFLSEHVWPLQVAGWGVSLMTVVLFSVAP